MGVSKVRLKIVLIICGGFFHSMIGAMEKDINLFLPKVTSRWVTQPGKLLLQPSIFVKRELKVDMDFRSSKLAQPLRYTKIIISGGYCAGKTSLIKLLEKKLGIPKLIDHSTRKMRPGEYDGFPYYFISRAQFEKNLALGKYYEWVEFCGNYYGVPKEEVFSDKIWSLDTLAVTWVSKYKAKVPGTYGIYLQSPASQVVIARARARGDSEEKIKQRLRNADNVELNSFDLVLPADLDLEEKVKVVVRQLTDTDELK